MSLHMGIQSNQTKKNMNSQVSGRLNRYTDRKPNMTNDTRGEERYIHTQKDPRLKRKDQLWIRIWRYTQQCPGPMSPASGTW